MMATGVYERSPEQKERLRKMVKEIAPFVPKGFHMSPKTEFKKGSIPWNKGRKWPEISGNNHPSRNPIYKEKFQQLFQNFKQHTFVAYGSDHPNWKGGKTSLIMKIRNHPKSIEWRNAIFERDHYTCQVCGDKRGNNLNAHHYIQVADIVHTLNIQTIEEALNAPILWNLSNGITLCKQCHKLADEASKAVKIIYGGKYE